MIIDGSDAAREEARTPVDLQVKRTDTLFYRKASFKNNLVELLDKMKKMVRRKD